MLSFHLQEARLAVRKERPVCCLSSHRRQGNAAYFLAATVSGSLSFCRVRRSEMDDGCQDVEKCIIMSSTISFTAKRDRGSCTSQV